MAAHSKAMTRKSPGVEENTPPFEPAEFADEIVSVIEGNSDEGAVATLFLALSNSA